MRSGSIFMFRLIPALAGTTRRAVLRPWSARAHPRAGGDDPKCSACGAELMGSSPRWRGRPCRSPTSEACAWAHPRAGGDDIFGAFLSVLDTGSSPRWRGRPNHPPRHSSALGLIPALAGTTPLSARVTSWSRAHPRAGGDDMFTHSASSRTGGSSPRWRGRLRDVRCPRRLCGLIPALAGTTLTGKGKCLSRKRIYFTLRAWRYLLALLQPLRMGLWGVGERGRRMRWTPS